MFFSLLLTSILMIKFCVCECEHLHPKRVSCVCVYLWLRASVSWASVSLQRQSALTYGSYNASTACQRWMWHSSLSFIHFVVRPKSMTILFVMKTHQHKWRIRKAQCRALTRSLISSHKAARRTWAWVQKGFAKYCFQRATERRDDSAHIKQQPGIGYRARRTLPQF